MKYSMLKGTVYSVHVKVGKIHVSEADEYKGWVIPS